MSPTKEEVTALLGELAESLKPAVLVLLDQIKPGVTDREKNLPRYKHNAATLDKWLGENATDNQTGKITYTLKDLRRAVSATKVSLYWVIAPRMRGAVSGVQGENNKPTRERGTDQSFINQVVQDAANKQAAERDAAILTQVSGLIAGHRSYPHSASFRQRDELRSEFERLKTAKTKPAEIEKAIRKMISTFQIGRAHV